MVSKVNPVDGNAFSVISAVAKRLREEGKKEVEREYRIKALDCGSYEELLQLSLEYVPLENWEGDWDVSNEE